MHLFEFFPKSMSKQIFLSLQLFIYSRKFKFSDSIIAVQKGRKRMLKRLHEQVVLMAVTVVVSDKKKKELIMEWPIGGKIFILVRPNY